VTMTTYDSQPTLAETLTPEPLPESWLKLLNVLEAAFVGKPDLQAQAAAMIRWLAENADVQRRRRAAA
jgi:hypothetical protein